MNYEQGDLFVESARITEQDLQEQFDKKNKENKLTPRQWGVLNLIEKNSLKEHRKTTQREIFEKVAGFEWNDEPKCHDHCVAIWNDIKDINLSYQTDKIIISKNFEYWIGNDEETTEFIDKLWNDLAPRLTRYWAYLKKAERNGQGIFIDRKGNVIDENSQAREYIESYGKKRIGD